MKKEIDTNPQEILFQAAFSHKKVASDLLENRLPTSIKNRLEFNSLTLNATTFIDKKFKKSYSDVVYSAKINGKDSYICILLKHGKTENRRQALFILEYIAKAIDQHLKEHPKCEKYPAVIPLVIDIT